MRSFNVSIVLSSLLILLMNTGQVMAHQKDIVYIEASTANRWNLGEFGVRVQDARYKIQTVIRYDFDKTVDVDRIVSDRGRKPDLVVLQECSVYFPGDMRLYEQKYRAWIKQIKQAGIIPAIATSVPPAHSQGLSEDVKTFIKVKILGRDSQYEQVIQFNEWLRRLAQDEKVPLIDLEAALRINDGDRHMRSDYDDGDGIHINRKAYDALDLEFLNLLKNTLR